MNDVIRSIVLLGSPRGPQDPAEMVQTLKDLQVGILFAIGGDGTLRGAQAIGNEATRQGLQISVIGIPKTIDNDISFVQRTFGFEPAVTEARRATYSANTEAEAARNGIGLVKMMGRDSRFIAAYAVLVNSQVSGVSPPQLRIRPSACCLVSLPRADEHGGQLLEPPVHPRPHPSRRVREEEDRLGRDLVEQSPRLDRSAGGHALSGPQTSGSGNGLERRALAMCSQGSGGCSTIRGMLDTSSSSATSDKRRSISIARAAMRNRPTSPSCPEVSGRNAQRDPTSNT